jgi:hypothetical protein
LSTLPVGDQLDRYGVRIAQDIYIVEDLRRSKKL